MAHAKTHRKKIITSVSAVLAVIGVLIIAIIAFRASPYADEIPSVVSNNMIFFGCDEFDDECTAENVGDNASTVLVVEGVDTQIRTAPTPVPSESTVGDPDEGGSEPVPTPTPTPSGDSGSEEEEEEPPVSTPSKELKSTKPTATTTTTTTTKKTTASTNSTSTSTPTPTPSASATATPEPTTSPVVTDLDIPELAVSQIEATTDSTTPTGWSSDVGLFGGFALIVISLLLLAWAYIKSD